ncbi:nucleotidyltransferase family protein [Glycocaulis profundi]|nr:nucleotidyltransferase family protein [Glycocaulis profundi]
MVMAAGVGSRMRPLTDDRCKALVEVDGRALIDWTLDRLEGVGVETVVVNVHHFADRLEAHLKARGGALDILISDEREALMETGGGLVKAAPLLGDAPIYTANIDALWRDPGERELARLAEGFDPETMDFRLMLARPEALMGMSGPGDFTLGEDGRLTRFRDDPDGSPLFYAGVQVMHPRVLEGLAVERFSTNRLWDAGLVRGRVTGSVMDAFWMHVGDPATRDLAENRLRSAA